MTYELLKQNEAVKTYILRADHCMKEMGYTEHGLGHVGKVANVAGNILRDLGYDEKKIELAKISAYLHDIGNLVNRDDHSQTGAVMAFRILNELGFDPVDIAVIVSAIGNHDEGTGIPVDEVAAALILADKSDVRRSRVRNEDTATFDIHDRVNFSVTDSLLLIDTEKKQVVLNLSIDTKYSSVMEYFEIFLNRMIMCKKAAEKLGLEFKLNINRQSLI